MKSAAWADEIRPRSGLIRRTISLRALLVVFTVLAVTIGLIGNRIRASREQQLALILLRQHGIETVQIESWAPALEVETVLLFVNGKETAALGAGKRKEALRAMAFAGIDVQAVVNDGDGDSRWSEALAHCPQLHTLEIHDTRVQAADVRALEPLGRLRKLVVGSGCRIDPDVDFSRLARVCPLEEVIVHCPARSRDFEAIVRSPQLKSASFQRLSELDANWRPATSRQLEGVYLRGCSLSAEQLRHFWTLPKLKVLSIGCADPEALRNVTPGPELRWLAIGSSRCGKASSTTWASVGGVQMTVSEH